MSESADDFVWTAITVNGPVINDLHYADHMVLIATLLTTLQLQLIDRDVQVSTDYGLETGTSDMGQLQL